MGMAKAILLGRITQELELKQTPNGTSVLAFTVAVERNYSKGEDKQSDFINCVAWKEKAEFISKYFGKGRMIAIEGNLRTRAYDDKNGVKHYVTEVYVDNVSFTGEKKQTETVHTNPADSIGNPDDYEDVLSDDGVPF